MKEQICYLICKVLFWVSLFIYMEGTKKIKEHFEPIAYFFLGGMAVSYILFFV